MTDANYDLVERLAAWAEARGRGMNELAQSWLLAQPRVCSVISGANVFGPSPGQCKGGGMGV